MKELITTFNGARTALAELNVVQAITSGEFWAMAAAEAAALWPILAIVAAIALVVAAVYELGKAFGWWSDVGSMLDAISAGLQRLWNAFVNHPDVQSAISVISSAWDWLSNAVGNAWNAVTEFFNLNTGGDFDIVHALIEAIGAAWEAITTPIRLVISVVQLVVDVFQQVISKAQEIQASLAPIWTGIVGAISPYINQIIGFVQGLMNTFNQFRNGQMDLPSFIINILTQLFNAYNTILLSIGRLVLKFGTQLLSYGTRAARNFMNGIINRLRQLPGQVATQLSHVVSRISSGIQAWINTASKKVSDLIKKITGPFNGVAKSISSALSGVASAITKPFSDAWNTLEPIVSKIKDGIDTISNIKLPFGGESAYGGETVTTDMSTGQPFEIVTGQYIVETDDKPIVIEDNINLTLDLQNVPTHINTNDLIKALGDKKVLSAIASNRDFQTIDSKVKQKINLKGVRAKGR